MPNSVWFSCSVFYNTHTKCTIASSLKQDLVQVGVELPLRKSIRHLFADWMDKGAKPLARLALKLQEVRGGCAAFGTVSITGLLVCQWLFGV